MSGRPSGLVMRVFYNAWQTLTKSKQYTAGKLVGKDPFGNSYFEIPADPRRGKRRASRWYVGEETFAKEVIGRDLSGGFDAELPSEWESWLRHRRDEPPTDETVMNSLAYADMKKRNAAKLEEERIEELKGEGRYAGPPKPMDHEKPFYPKYDEYEVMPGETPAEAKGRWDSFKNPYRKEDGSTVTKK